MLENYKKILPIAIDSGLTYTELQDMNMIEILEFIEAYKSLKEARGKEKQYEIYALASITASFVGCVLSGKSLPSFEATFSNNDTTNNIDYIREKLTDFANRRY